MNGEAYFAGIITAQNVTVSSGLTAVGPYNINNVSSGSIQASSVGIGTTNTLLAFQVGSANTLGVSTDNKMMVISGIGSVGIGTTVATANLDVHGHTRLRSYSENVGILTIVSNVVTVDLTTAQTFTLEADDGITSFTLKQPPSDSTSFTIKIVQDSTGSRSVGIDTFKDESGSSIPVYWPGGVVPIVTTTASRSDIYSFKTFDGGATLYGIVGGQNFS